MEEFYDIWVNNWGRCKSRINHSIMVHNKDQRDYCVSLLRESNPGSHIDKTDAHSDIGEHFVSYRYVRCYGDTCYPNLYRVAPGGNSQTDEEFEFLHVFELASLSTFDNKSHEGRIISLSATEPIIITTKTQAHVLQGEIEECIIGSRPGLTGRFVSKGGAPAIADRQAGHPKKHQ